jgi:hypothetical protein
VALPDRIFQELLSKPFEERIIQLFRAHGFIAGEVTQQGAWRTQSGVFELPPNIEKPKGQIDLVAWRADYMLTADCKVLQLPQDSKSLCSLWDKIRAENSKYRQQVRRAASWSVRFLNAYGLSAGNNQMALILDRPLHFWHQDNDVIVTDYELIAEELVRQPHFGS